MKKTYLLLLTGLICSSAWADGTLGGYFYNQQAAPTGWEWQSPDSVAVNKQQPHAWFFSFRNVEEARKVYRRTVLTGNLSMDYGSSIGLQILMSVLRISTVQTMMYLSGTTSRCL